MIPIKMACAELWGSFTLHRDRSHLFGSVSIISVLVSASVSVIISVNTPLKCKLNNLQLLALSSIGAYSDIWVLDVLLMKCTVELEFIIICDIMIFHLNETK